MVIESIMILSVIAILLSDKEPVSSTYKPVKNEEYYMDGFLLYDAYL
jgi:hypothetical protein